MKKTAALWIALWAVSVLAVLPPAAFAQTLQEALQSTWQTNPSLAASRQQLRSAEERRLQAALDLGPSLTASAQWADVDATQTRTEGMGAGRTTGEPYRSSRTTLSIRQDLLNLGRNRASFDLANLDEDIAREELRTSESAVLRQTITAYSQVILNRRTVALRLSAVERLRRQLTVAETQVSAGRAGRTELAQAQAAFSAAEANAIDAKARLKDSEAGFETVTGLAPGPLDDAYTVDIPLPDNLDAARTMMVAQNPSLAAAGLRLAKAERTLALTPLAFLPQLSLTASRTEGENLNQNNTESENTTVALNLTYIVTPARLASARRQAKANTLAAAENRHALLKQNERRLIGNWELWQASALEVQARDKAVEASLLVLEGERRQAEAGAASVLDVLDAEENLLDAQLRNIDARTRQTTVRLNLLELLGLLNAGQLNLETR